MGTRNLTIVVQESKPKVSQYCQWDGYPAGVGSSILKFFHRSDFDLSIFKSKISNISEYTNTEIEEIDKIPNWDKEYSHLAREMGPEILNQIYDGSVNKVYLDNEFIYDSLFCEWAYIIDLDNNFLEVYKGFNKEKLKVSEKFYRESPNESGYYACKLYGIFSLNDLPTIFLDEDNYQSKNGTTGLIENTLKSAIRETKISDIMKNEE